MERKGETRMPSDEAPRPPDNPWDRLSDYFDTSKEEDEIPAGAADNILIAWPVFFRFIADHVPDLSGKLALDYGCGAGSFAHRLCTYGCHVTGVDSSPAMIAKATRAYGDAVDFRVGDATLLEQLPPSALITSIMALQFVADIAPLLDAFAAALDTNGHLIFAVHNPTYFSGETLRFSNGVEVPIFIRSAGEYHALAERAGFEPLLEEYPPFTDEFIARYPTYAERPAPEYLILGYRTGGTSRCPHASAGSARWVQRRARRIPPQDDGAAQRGKRVAICPPQAGACGIWPQEETMHYSEDVRDAFIRFLADVSSGSDAWADRFACTGDGASLIGTDDTEWFQCSAMRAAWTDLAHAFQTAGMRIVASDPYAYAEGRSAG